MGESHVFQGEWKGDQSSQADYKGGGNYRKLTVKKRGGHYLLQSLRGYQVKLNCGTTRLLRPACKAINDDQSLNS